MISTNVLNDIYIYKKGKLHCWNVWSITKMLIPYRILLFVRGEKVSQFLRITS